MNIQGLFLLGLTWLDILVVQETLRVFSSIRDQKHRFFGSQSSLGCIHDPYMTPFFHIHT